MNGRAIVLTLCVLLLLGVASAQPSHAPIVNLPTADIPVGSVPVVDDRSMPLTLDDPLGTIYPAGNTYYDLQHNGSAGKMLYVDQNGYVHLVWTRGATQILSGPRHVYYQLWDPGTSAMTFPSAANPAGIQADNTTRAGFTSLGGHPSGWVYPAYHETRTGVGPAGSSHAAAGFDFAPYMGAFSSSYPNLITVDGTVLNLLWPKAAIGSDTMCHMLSTESPPSLGQPGYHTWQRLYYSRAVPEFEIGGTMMGLHWQAVAPGNAHYMLIDTVTTVSADIAASRFSGRVAMAYTKPIEHNPDSVTQYNNDVFVRISENGGYNWGAPINITQFVPADTQRAYTDVSIIFDESDVIHVAFTTIGYYSAQNTINSIFSMIWHWDEQSQDFTVLANSYGEPWMGDAQLGAWNRLVQRPSLSADPSTGYLYCSYQGFDVNSWSSGGYYLADAFVTVSTNNGQGWALATNISSDNAFPPVPDGQCASQRDITLADRVTYADGTGYLHLSLVLDRSAGSAPSGEGAITNNVFQYQRLSINTIPASPLVPTVPLHVGIVIPQGRCCYGDSLNPLCAMMTYDACQAVAGLWDPSLNCTTPCTSEPPVVGRCCYGDSATSYCAMTTYEICQALRGEWYPSLTCATPCPGLPPVVGRCCYGDSTNPSCAMWIETDCQAVGGLWDPALTCTTSCAGGQPVEGRCCYGPDPFNPYCSTIPEDLCQRFGGQWDSQLTCSTPCTPAVCSFRNSPNLHCNDAGGEIPDGGAEGVDIIIPVPIQYHITDVNACIDITHPEDGDLVVTLRSPAGHSSVLTSHQGANGANYRCTVFDDQAFDSVASGYPPFTGTWQPETPLAVFNGENAQGNWILHVVDWSRGDSGWVNWVCLNFSYDEILPVELASFDAVGRADGVHISFATATENNNAHFEILRGGSNSGSFSRIASLNSQGNSSSQQTYHFVDTDVNPGQTYWYYLVDVSVSGARTEHRNMMRSALVTTAVVPQEYSLNIFPNPFNPATTVRFTLTEAAEVHLAFFDVTGRRVGTALDKRFEAGAHSVTFDGSGMPAGVYFVRIEAGPFSKTLKMMLLK
jgi:subtilisin-like proprotein convertase family protein